MPPWHCHNYLAQYFYILDLGTTVLNNCDVFMMDRYMYQYFQKVRDNLILNIIFREKPDIEALMFL